MLSVPYCSSALIVLGPEQGFEGLTCACSWACAGKALLAEGSPADLKAEEQESLVDWEKAKDPAAAAPETIAGSVGSFMKSLW